MFDRKTVLILGAGASAEFSMPVGSELITQITDTLQFQPGRGDPRFRGRIHEDLDTKHAARLVAAAPGLASLMSRFDSMDEVLHFLSGEPDALELGKIGIAYHILKAERSSAVYGMLSGDRDAVSQCDSTWASRFLRIALSGSRRNDFRTVFQNVTVIDFNYDRIVPQYLHSGLQRLYKYSEDEATESLSGLRILRPYGFLGPLEWQTDNMALPLGYERAPLLRTASRLRTFTEERNDPEIHQIKQAVADARAVLVLGFGFHNQNIEIISVGRAQLTIPCFMTVMGINTANHSAVALRMQRAIQSFQVPMFLVEKASTLMQQLRPSISLAVGTN
jgi:hypothetical protein